MKQLLVGLLLIFLRTCHGQEHFDVLKISNVTFPLQIKPVASLNVGYTRSISEFTFCYRILVESYNDGYMPFFIAWKPVEERGNYEESTFFVESTTFFSGFELQGFQAGFNFLYRNIPGGGIGNRSMPIWHHLVLARFIEPGKWGHFCTSYSSIEHIYHKYQDGHKVFSYRFTDEVEGSFPPAMFDNLEIAQVQIDFRSIDSPNWLRFLNKRGRKIADL